MDLPHYKTVVSPHSPRKSQILLPAFGRKESLKGPLSPVRSNQKYISVNVGSASKTINLGISSYFSESASVTTPHRRCQKTECVVWSIVEKTDDAEAAV